MPGKAEPFRTSDGEAVEVLFDCDGRASVTQTKGVATEDHPYKVYLISFTVAGLVKSESGRGLLNSIVSKLMRPVWAPARK